MVCVPPVAAGDRRLIQIVDSSLADAAARSGEWLACRPGCAQCCTGAFAITQLDAARLRQGHEDLGVSDPARAQRVRERAQDAVSRLSNQFPGDDATGILDEGEEAEERFESFANDEPCPALDPVTRTCDLYSSRPITCRIFGPPVRSEGGLGVCELCFVGATPEEIAKCEMEVDPESLEPALLEEIEKTTGACGQTIVAFALAGVHKHCDLHPRAECQGIRRST